VERLLFFQDSAPSTANYLFKSFAKPIRMSPFGGVTTDSGAIILADTTRGPFGRMAQHDLLRFYTVNPRLDASYRQINTVTSNSSITVDSAITLAGATNYEWMKASRGLDNDADQLTKGWASVGGWRTKTLIIQIITFPAEGFAIKIETRDAGQQQKSLYYQTAYSTINDVPQTFDISADVASIRVGILASDTGSVSNGSITMSLRGDSAR
jgi:hypothetical protein